MEEKPPITNERADALVNEAPHLLTGSADPAIFAARYATIRVCQISVASAHAEISKSFG